MSARPLAIAQLSSTGAQIISCCCDGALQSGIRPGMSLAEARATTKHLAVFADDPERDVGTLKKLAVWADRYSPIVGVEEGPAPQALLLDITGCAGCFGGEDRLARAALGDFRERGWLARVAIADTPGAAWGLAHQAHDLASAAPGETERALRPLSVAALRLPRETFLKLASLGIDQIGQLLELPRTDLNARFGPMVLLRLDRALGRLAELIEPCRPRPIPQVFYTFEYPTDQYEYLCRALEHLLERLTPILRNYHCGAKHLQCWLYHETAEADRIDLQVFQPTRSSAHLGKLLRTHLEKIRLAEPVSGICLRVPLVEKMPERQCKLFDEEEPGGPELAALIDRLVGRLGREAVALASLVPDPQPELACRFEPALSVPSTARKQKAEKKSVLPSFASAHDFPGFLHGPVQLWPVPEPIEALNAASEGTPSGFRRLGKEYAVKRSWGPERIATGWWRGHDIERDYYTVETRDGTRWWIFRRNADDRWFLHGCFD
jgi:protein ImuB